MEREVIFLNNYSRHVCSHFRPPNVEWCRYFHFYFICGKKEKRRLSKVNQLTQPYTASMAELDTNICLPDFRVCVSFLSPYTSLHVLSCFWLSSEIVWFFSQGTQSSHMKVPYLPTSAKWKRRKCFHLLPNSGILNNKQHKVLSEE